MAITLLNKELNENSLLRGLKGWWRMDHGSGLWAYDSSGLCNHGQMINMDATNWRGGANRVIGNALYFDGVNEEVNCGQAESLNLTGAVTIAAWINTATLALPNNHRMIFTAEALSYLSITSNLAPKPFISLDIAGAQETVNSEYTLSANTWYHVAATYCGATIKIFVDGNEKASKNVSGVLDFGNTVDKQIGGYVIAGYNFNGLIDDIRVFNRALTADEVAYLARLGS